jgi:dCTP deaminase
MGLKSDKWIREKSLKEEMITPFCEGLVGEGVVSYGLSSYGYDIRVTDEFKIFTNINAEVVDPKDFNENNVVDFKGDVCIVPPNSFALARTVEYFKMPSDTLAICLGKSTYARCFEGHITIEISNTTPLPAKIYANEGIAQVLFLQGDEQCETTYSDRKGKYQSQTGITLPRILKQS